MLSKKFFIFKILTLTFSVITLIFYILSFATSYDFNIGYFNISPVVIISRILLALTVISSVSCIFIIPKKTITPDNINSGKRFYPAILCTVAFLAYSLFKIYAVISVGKWSAVSVFSIIFAILSCVYYFLIFIGIKVSETNFALLGFSQIVWFVTVVASSYFDYSVAQNSPQKIIIMFSAMAAMLYVLSEIKVVLGKQSSRIHFSLDAPTIVLCSIGTALNIFLIANTGADAFSDYIFYAGIFFSVAVYVILRLVLVSPSTSADTELSESDADTGKSDNQ